MLNKSTAFESENSTHPHFWFSFLYRVNVDSNEQSCKRRQALENIVLV